MASMTQLPSLMLGTGFFLEGIGLIQQGRMARIAGERAKVNAQFASWQAEREAGIALALSQRQALEERRQGDIEMSRALAVAAASGGGVSDPTIVNLLANVKGEAVYRANVALYEGEARGRQLRLEAAAGRYSGSLQQLDGARTEQAYRVAAIGKTFEGGASLYARYGMNGPGTEAKGDSALISNSSWQG